MKVDKLKSSFIGVFWVDAFTAQIYADKIPVSEGEDYNHGQLKVYPRAHIDMWRKIQMMNPAWKDIKNYEDIPRGRVAFRQTDNKFLVVMCSKLNTNRIKREIARTFNLPYRSCDFLTDAHYEIPKY